MIRHQSCMSLPLGRCRHSSPTKAVATWYCFALSLGFIAAIYYGVPSDVRRLPRNHTRHIKWRLVAVSAYVLLSVATYPFCAPLLPKGLDDRGDIPTRLQLLGLSINLRRDGKVLVHTSLLFLGPIITKVIDWGRSTCQIRGGFDRTASNRFSFSRMLAGSFSGNLVTQLHPTWQKVRDYLIAPLSEEIVFRGCMTPALLSSGMSIFQVSLISPLFFGTAHIHHAILKLRSGSYAPSHVALATMFQTMYTSLFGAYVTYAYIRTGSLLAITWCHIFCNIIGFPDLAFLKKSSSLFVFRHFVVVAYFFGICSFIVGFRSRLVFEDAFDLSALLSDGYGAD